MTEQHDRIRAAALEILAALDDDGEQPGGLRPPTGFTAVWDAARRRLALRWVDAPGAAAVESHESEADPAATLKATVPAADGERWSSELRGGRYRWALRSVGLDGELSDFTEWIVTDVPLKGDEPAEPDEPDEGEGPQPGGPHPHNVLDLRLWTVMLPVMKPDGDTPKNDYAAKWGTVAGLFFVRDGAVVFRTPADGDHSKNSNYARTEARQMRGPDWDEAAFPSSGSHSLECEFAIDTRGLSTRPRIVAMQIHGGGDDVCQVIYERGVGLGLAHNDGDSWELIDPDYRDGQRVTCRILAENNRIKVFYNGAQVIDIPKTGSSWYFKWGCYLQTGGASKHIEPAGAFGEVTVWRYAITGI